MKADLVKIDKAVKSRPGGQRVKQNEIVVVWPYKTKHQFQGDGYSIKRWVGWITSKTGHGCPFTIS